MKIYHNKTKEASKLNLLINSRKELVSVNENGVLTIQQVAKRLQVSLPWLYRATKEGTIPHIRIGGMIRFRQYDIDAWLNAHKIDEVSGNNHNKTSGEAE